MSIRPVSQIGDKVIRAKAKPVAVRAARTKRIVADLVSTMRKHNLVGMAAPQIGEGARIFVTELRKTKFRKSLRDIDPLRVFINPRIIRRSQAMSVGMEGCGSVAEAGLFGPVRRHASVTIVATDTDGRLFRFVATGFLARVIQHEYDHLNGVVILDRFTDTRQVLDMASYIRKPKTR